MTYVEIVAALGVVAYIIMWLENKWDEWNKKPPTAAEVAKLQAERAAQAEETKEKIESLNAGLEMLRSAGASSSAKMEQLKEDLDRLKKEDEDYKKWLATATEEQLKGELKKNGLNETDFE